MKTYLLLRNNKQSGPFTLSEILAQGLRPQDLVWVEGRSASWRYPSELDEFKAFVPPPVLDEPVNLGFSEVQKRVVGERLEHSAPIANVLDAGVSRSNIEPYEMATFIAPPSFHGRTPSFAGTYSSVPAFEALAGLLSEDDVMPTMAWQEAVDKTPSIKRISILGGTPDVSSRAGITQQSSGVGGPKIKVLLPAVMADKTMVVIRRRDLKGQPIQETNARTRRPVLEFIPEDIDAEPAEIDLPADIKILAESPSSVPEEKTVNHGQDAGFVELTAVQSKHPVNGYAVALPAESAVAQDDVFLSDPIVESPVFSHQSRITEGRQFSAGWEVVTPESWPMAQVAQTLEVNVSLLQKIAVVTAIISLLAVAILIANSIFNPRAYQYGAKAAKTSSEQVSPPVAGNFTSLDSITQVI